MDLSLLFAELRGLFTGIIVGGLGMLIYLLYRKSSVNESNQETNETVAEHEKINPINEQTETESIESNNEPIPETDRGKADGDDVIEIETPNQLKMPETLFKPELPIEEFKKWCSDEKFLIASDDELIAPVDRKLFTVVRDYMSNGTFLEKYGRCVEYVRIYCQGINTKEPSVYRQMSQYCSGNLKEIELYDLEGHEINSFTNEFPAIERVQFKTGKIGPNIAAKFSQLFSNVKQLEFSHKLDVIHDRNIIQTHFHRLECFEASYDETKRHFTESDIMNALDLNKQTLRRITLWGKLTPALLSFISQQFPQLKMLSMEGVPERVITTPPKGCPYVFKRLEELEISMSNSVHDIGFPFDLGQLQKIKLNLSLLPASWIESFFKKNEHVRHLSLSLQPKEIDNVMTLNIKSALPKLEFLEIDFASKLDKTTVMKLLEISHLNELLFSHLNGVVYAQLKTDSEQIKTLGWNVMFFSKFVGARFQRKTEISNHLQSRKTERTSAMKVHNWYDAQLTNVVDVALKRLSIFFDDHRKASVKSGSLCYSDNELQLIDHHRAAQFLRTNGVDLNLKNTHGQTPLHSAAEYGYAIIVEYLVQNGANVNLEDKDGRAPLHGATFNGSEKVVKILVQNGANVNLEDNSGETPLHRAASNGSEKVVEILVQNGANVNLEDNSGETPLHKAAYWGSEKVVEILVQNGANVNLENKDGRAPLHRAASNGRVEVVEILVQNGANVNKDGWALAPRNKILRNYLIFMLENKK